MGDFVSVRHDLAAYLAGAFPDQNVYASPPGKVEVPAIVITPDSPYLEPETFCLYRWGFEVGFIIGRTARNADLDTLDETISRAFPILENLPTGTVSAVRSVPQFEIGGTPYIAAVFSIGMKGTL